MPLLSFVIPCYRSELTISKVVEEIVNTVSEKPQYDYEIIAINDSSPDGVYSVLVNLASKNKRIKVINFAKNMGKHSAIMAGFSFVSGDYIVNIDDDYQCPVNNLWRLLEPVENDVCDVATAYYSKKKERLFKRIGSGVNHWMTRIQGVPSHGTASFQRRSRLHGQFLHDP